MIGEENPPLRLGKACQISAPSDRQIVDLLDEMTHRVNLRRRFNGQTVNKQVFLNNVIIGLAKLGPETWDHIFDEGASILGPALMAGEPGIPLAAARPLRKRFRWFDGHYHDSDDEPEVKPLPSAKVASKRVDDGRRREGKG